MNSTIKSNHTPATLQALIGDTPCEGYFWYSDASNIETIEGTVNFIDKLSDLPFVVEGYLKAGDLSINIKNVDGKYYLTTCNLQNWTPTESTQLKLAKPVNGYQFIEFAPVFKEVHGQQTYQTQVIFQFSKTAKDD